MSEPIQSVSIVDAIEEHLKKMIVEGKLAPGAQLPSERELQETLGVSRLPLREALARLEALGLLKIRHGKGTFVEERVSNKALRDVLIAFFPDRDPERLRELVEARGLLESEISALACARATGEDLDQLEALARAGAEALGGAESFGEADYTFHHAIAKVARNGFLLLMHEALGPHIRSFISAYASTPEQRKQAHERNLSLVRAIRSGDSQAAGRMAREHLQPCLQGMMKAAVAPAKTGGRKKK